MRTSELAGRAAVNPQTLRYYERRGLLAEPARSAGGYRSYPPEAAPRVRFIKRAQELGLTLAEVVTLLDPPAVGRNRAMECRRSPPRGLRICGRASPTCVPSRLN